LPLIAAAFRVGAWHFEQKKKGRGCLVAMVSISVIDPTFWDFPDEVIDHIASFLAAGGVAPHDRVP
jgi:hypothetical protein